MGERGGGGAGGIQGLEDNNRLPGNQELFHLDAIVVFPFVNVQDAVLWPVEIKICEDKY